MTRLTRLTSLTSILVFAFGCKNYQYATSSPTQTAPQPVERHTVFVPSARASVTIDNESYSARVAFSTTIDSLVIWSIQPIAGMELFRVEATPDEVIVFDKTSSICIPISYSQLAKYLPSAITFSDIQAIATGDILPLGRTKTLRSYSGFGKTVILEIEYPDIRCNVPVNMHRLSPLRFEVKQVEELL